MLNMFPNCPLLLSIGVASVIEDTHAPPVAVISIDPIESFTVGVLTIKVEDESTPTGAGSVIVT
tara:strand:- start:622 stop:813 length:192 start_codon:yes stop_codon:yes gene_type:complete